MVKVIGEMAAFLGWTVRMFGLALLVLPQVVGLALVAYGVALFDYRVAIILIGAFLVLLGRPTDRRRK